MKLNTDFLFSGLPGAAVSSLTSEEIQHFFCLVNVAKVCISDHMTVGDFGFLTLSWFGSGSV